MTSDFWSHDSMIMCRFYLCLWYKDDPKSQEKLSYCFARLNSKAIVRDFGTISCFLTRESAKKISLALGQNNSFSRGFDKILYMLLVSNYISCGLSFPFLSVNNDLLSYLLKKNWTQASLRENSPILRAKALRAVSKILFFQFNLDS